MEGRLASPLCPLPLARTHTHTYAQSGLCNGTWIYSTIEKCVVCTESDSTDQISLILLSVLRLSMFTWLLWHFFFICFVCIINNNTITFQMTSLVAIRLWGKMGVLDGLTIELSAFNSKQIWKMTLQILILFTRQRNAIFFGLWMFFSSSVKYKTTNWDKNPFNMI